MENLWKKEDDRFIDIFQNLRSTLPEKYDQDFKDWDRYLDELGPIELMNTVAGNKNEHIAERNLEEAEGLYSKNDYHLAMEKCNKALNYSKQKTAMERYTY